MGAGESENSAKIREVEWRLISELVKNSRRSDRALAKALNVSQPTVSRLIKKLEKEGFIKEYTMIPDLCKLGYELLAFTFIKFSRMYSPEEVERAKNGAYEFFKKGPFEIILIERGTGLGYHGVFVSFHENYTAYMKFSEKIREMMSESIATLETFLVSLADPVHYRSLTFSTLAQHFLTLKGKKQP